MDKFSIDVSRLINGWWEKRSIVTEMWDNINEIPYAPNDKEDTTKQLLNKCRMLRNDQRPKPPAANEQLAQLVNRAHLGDQKMRKRILNQIQEALRYDEERQQ